MMPYALPRLSPTHARLLHLRTLLRGQLQWPQRRQLDGPVKSTDSLLSVSGPPIRNAAAVGMTILGCPSIYHAPALVRDHSQFHLMQATFNAASNSCWALGMSRPAGPGRLITPPTPTSERTPGAW